MSLTCVPSHRRYISGINSIARPVIKFIHNFSTRALLSMFACIDPEMAWPFLGQVWSLSLSCALLIGLSLILAFILFLLSLVTHCRCLHVGPSNCGYLQSGHPSGGCGAAATEQLRGMGRRADSMDISGSMIFQRIMLGLRSF